MTEPQDSDPRISRAEWEIFLARPQELARPIRESDPPVPDPVEIEPAAPKRPEYGAVANKILLVMCIGGALFLIMGLTLPVAEPVLVIIALLASVVLYFFPGIRNLHRRAWFASSFLSIGLAALFLGQAAVGWFYLIPRLDANSVHDSNSLKLTQIQGMTSEGCAYCVLTIEGSGIRRLEPKSRLEVYGAQARLVDGRWSETPIALIEVLKVDSETVLAQVLLIHEQAADDESKRLKPNLRVTTLPREIGESYTEFLVPTSGDGFMLDAERIRLMADTGVKPGDLFATLEVQYQGQRIVDHMLSDTRLRVTSLGDQGLVAEAELVSGMPARAGDIVRSVTGDTLQSDKGEVK